MSDSLKLLGVGYAYANHGRWVVDCPRPDWRCASALQMFPLVSKIFTCWDCGYVSDEIVWPNDVAAIQMLLRMRPDPKTRNWKPGETLQSLIMENIANGVMSDRLKEIGSGKPSNIEIMSTHNDVLTGGVLLDDLTAEQNRIEEMGDRLDGAVKGIS